MNGTMKITALLLTSSMMTLGLSLSGCSAMNTAIEKHDLAVGTKMSETIFLEPVAPKYKVVYFDFRNTSDQDMDIQAEKASIQNTFIQKGYKITQDPEEATFMLQANILKIGKSDLKESQKFLGEGFAAGAQGAVMGVGAAYAMGSSNQQMAGLGLAGAALGFIGDALVKDVFYVMVTDLQIRERPLAGEVVTQTQDASLQQGSSTKVQQHTSGAKVEWKTYRTRIVSTANKMNLKFEDAKAPLEVALVHSISGIF